MLQRETRPLDSTVGPSLSGELGKLDTFIFKKMANYKLPGLSIAAIKDGETVHKRGYGFRDLARGESTTPETLYCVGSVTKSFTSLAMMQLQEEGLLDIDDPVDDYLPLNVRPMEEPIRIRHLMSHTSGIPALAYAEAALSLVTKAPGRWLPISNYEDLLTFMRDTDVWAHSRPGERWFYLNEGYILLGAIIEKASGLSYPDYVKKHILEPLDMRRSFFHKEDVDRDHDVATPYATTQDNEREASAYTYGNLLSDGGLISSVTDMANYVKMLLAGGEFNGRRIASAKSIGSMMEPWTRTPDEPIEGEGLIHYGYGLNIKRDFLGRSLINHSGSVFVATAYMGFIPEEKVGVVVLANGSGYPLGYIGEYALALLMGEDWMDIPALRREMILDELTGTYETYMGTMKIAVTRRWGLLQLEIKGWGRGFTIHPMPVDLKGETKLFNLITLDRKIPVEFYEMDGDTYMIYERYKLKRVGRS